MANQDQHDSSVRRPQPEAAAQDARNAAIQEQVQADTQANRESAARVRATTPNELSEGTVADIAADAEARARR